MNIRKQSTTTIQAVSMLSCLLTLPTKAGVMDFIQSVNFKPSRDIPAAFVLPFLAHLQIHCEVLTKIT